MLLYMPSRRHSVWEGGHWVMWKKATLLLHVRESVRGKHSTPGEHAMALSTHY